MPTVARRCQLGKSAVAALLGRLPLSQPQAEPLAAAAAAAALDVTNNGIQVGRLRVIFSIMMGSSPTWGPSHLLRHSALENVVPE